MFTLPYTEPFIPTAIAQTLERVLWIYSSERRGTRVCRQNILNHTVIIQMATHITISVTIFALLFVFLHIVQPVLRETFHRGNNVRQKIGAVSPLVFWRSRRVQPGATLLQLCCVISLCSGRLTLCAFAGAQPPRPPVFPPPRLISILSSASHFCHQFGNNCHHHSVLVKSLFLTTQTSYQHAEIFFSDYRRVCVGGDLHLSYKIEGERWSGQHALTLRLLWTCWYGISSICSHLMLSLSLAIPC